MVDVFASTKLTAPQVVIIVVALTVILVFEIWMFVHVIRNAFITTNRRLLWILGMVLIHPIVAIWYYFTDYKKTS